MTLVTRESVRQDYRATLEKIRDIMPDYFVPIPRKAVKSLKLFPELTEDLGSRLYYTTAFSWSPTLARGVGKSISILDDATVRGLTLHRHRTRFEATGARVRTHAVYRCQQARDLKAPVKGPFELNAVVTENLPLQDYRQYQQLLKDWFAPVNPLLEHDHFRGFVLYKGSSEGFFDAFVDLATSIGLTIQYPQATDGDTLSLTSLRPHQLRGLVEEAAEMGLDNPHVKLRLYASRPTGRITVVPMFFPEVTFNAKASQPYVVWEHLRNVAARLGQDVAAFTAPVGLRESQRLIYELCAHSLASLGYWHLKATAFSEFDRSGEASSTVDTADLYRRFGPEVGKLAMLSANDPEAARLLVRSLAASFVVNGPVASSWPATRSVFNQHGAVGSETLRHQCGVAGYPSGTVEKGSNTPNRGGRSGRVDL